MWRRLIQGAMLLVGGLVLDRLATKDRKIRIKVTKHNDEEGKEERGRRRRVSVVYASPIDTESNSDNELGSEA